MGKVLLSFDTEEFDLPREHGAKISVKEGAKVSAEGLEKILDILASRKARATFFCTANFAKEQPDLIRRIYDDGHEVACHGVDHFAPKATDAKDCKDLLEKMLPIKVAGYRQPRMQKINYRDLEKWGYKYDSSVNPAFIPGRYNHLNVPRKPFKKEGILEVPTSVVTFLRIPLFWLALHLFPLKVYMRLVEISIKETGYFATYFHPWEFAKLDKFKVVPGYIKRNSGDKLAKRLDVLVCRLKKKNDFMTYDEFCRRFKEK